MKRASPHRLEKEKVLLAAELSNPEARFLVSSYYASQDMRKRLDMQRRHLVGMTTEKPLPVYSLLDFSADRYAAIEEDMHKALQVYADTTQVGKWCQSHIGIGPVLTAGFMAHLDITQAPTAGHFWSFAGLDPLKKWEKGEKRPYSADVKQLCFHLGECAKRVCNHPGAYYGALYKQRKEKLVARNEAGYNAERAKTFFTKSKEWKKTLEKGKLPDGNLDRQACNWVSKMFLSHLHAVMYWDHHHTPPPRPFAIAHLGHAHELRIPNVEMFPGLNEAYYGGESGSAVAA